MARLKLVGHIAELMGFREKEVKVDRPTRLETVLKLPKELDEKRVIIIVNGASASLSKTIEDEDEILVMPVVGGG